MVKPLRPAGRCLGKRPFHAGRGGRTTAHGVDTRGFVKPWELAGAQR